MAVHTAHDGASERDSWRGSAGEMPVAVVRAPRHRTIVCACPGFLGAPTNVRDPDLVTQAARTPFFYRLHRGGSRSHPHRPLKRPRPEPKIVLPLELESRPRPFGTAMPAGHVFVAGVEKASSSSPAGPVVLAARPSGFCRCRVFGSGPANRAADPGFEGRPRWP